ncbi:MAG: FKBP-type peptidyl-prolyl cis-trans isomerase [Faecalibacterium sp.]
MKQFTKILSFVCAGALAFSMAGCSFFKGSSPDSSSASASPSVSVYGTVDSFDYENFSYSNGLEENGYWTGVHALDYVTLPEDVAALSIRRKEVEPSSEEVQEEIDSLLSQNAVSAQVTDRKAANGDTVNIDYTGTVNGVAFTGGTYAGYDLTLGSGTFIDGFEEQIVGHIPGEIFEVNVTFPDGYGDSTDAEGNTITLSGARAVFTVTLNYISETILPDLTDEWVSNSYGESDGLHTVEELRAYLTQMIYKSNLSSAVFSTLMESATFREVPQVITDYQVNECLNYYYTMSGYYGYEMEDFVQSLLGFENADAMLASMDSSIEEYSKEALLYQAVAEALDIQPTQEQIDQYAGYFDFYGENYCRMISLMDAVTTTLAENAVVS